MIDFIGIGAQKSGTSWAYTCLYEHPEICMPVKEIHFFSRSRYAQGIDWYENHFKKCDSHKKKGEWSTSYLYSKETASRIKQHYPNVKLLAILRNPVDRAYSQYRNAIRAGEIQKTMSFSAYDAQEKSVREQGLYATQLEEYFQLFDKGQMLILIYEDLIKDPVAFMKNIYTFLEVEDTYVASMVHEQVNIARTPTLIGVDRCMHHISEFLRRNGFDRLVHTIRKTGITKIIRMLNTTQTHVGTREESFNKKEYAKHFAHDVTRLSMMVDRDLRTEWNI